MGSSESTIHIAQDGVALTSFYLNLSTFFHYHYTC